METDENKMARTWREMLKTVLCKGIHRLQQNSQRVHDQKRFGTAALEQVTDSRYLGKMLQNFSIFDKSIIIIAKTITAGK